MASQNSSEWRLDQFWVGFYYTLPTSVFPNTINFERILCTSKLQESLVAGRNPGRIWSTDTQCLAKNEKTDDPGKLDCKNRDRSKASGFSGHAWSTNPLWIIAVSGCMDVFEVFHDSCTFTVWHLWSINRSWSQRNDFKKSIWILSCHFFLIWESICVQSGFTVWGSDSNTETCLWVDRVYKRYTRLPQK